MSETHFDAIVVGSGFGGSVMTYRLAQEGLRVCLLERGKPYPPNSFPRSPVAMKKNFWNPSEGLYGLYNVWSFQGINSVVSSGLGGGSLIYANVMLRKDEKWFVHEDIQKGGYEYWPVTRADLDPHYKDVEEMLNVQTYPFDKPPYSATSKTMALKKAAEKLGMDWSLPNLAVTFSNKGEEPAVGEPICEEPNLHGRTRYTCRLCGECDIGCNYGSKNTLDYNYLSRAKQTGNAEIRTCCEVRSFEPKEGGGYMVHYVVHDPEKHEGKPLETHNVAALPLQCITTDRLILSAGTFGSPYLLLKNRAAFPRISKLLGTRFSGNGDLINFAVYCSNKSSSGMREPHIIDGGHGPVITSAIRFADHQDGVADPNARGFYIEDAGYPEFVNWVLQVFDTPNEAAQTMQVAEHLFKDWLHKKPETDLSKYVSQMFGTCELSACLLPLLGMGRDIPNGTMTLNGNVLELDWTKDDGSRNYFNTLRCEMEKIATALGAKFIDDPIWYLSRVITVHPLGGCPMGRNKAEGVVNNEGQVFDYDGLYVADGSVMPGPVGANPSLTIAALADHFAEKILDKMGRKNR